MRFWIATLISLFLGCTIVSVLPSLDAERDFYKLVKLNFENSTQCPNLVNARQTVQKIEREFVKKLKDEKSFFGLARHGRLNYNDILVQSGNRTCSIGYVMEVDLRPLLVFPYSVHSVRKIALSKAE
jgi:hypothetical protein